MSGRGYDQPPRKARLEGPVEFPAPTYWSEAGFERRDEGIFGPSAASQISCHRVTRRSRVHRAVHMIWFKDCVAVVGLLSVYALVITMKGVKAAAEAEVAGYANPKMDEDEAPASRPGEGAGTQNSWDRLRAEGRPSGSTARR
jgi:hypothetical protein